MWTGPKFKEKKTALLRSMTVFTVLASGSALALLPGNVFWPYFAGLVILLIGATGVSGDVLAARGWDKIVALGPVCYGVPLAVFGAEHFASAQFIVKAVPSWMPGPWFWTYFVGTSLFAAALSLALKKHAGLAAGPTALMLFCFVLMLHIPGALAKTGDRFRWIVALRDLSFSAGALAFAGAQMAEKRGKTASAMIAIGRVVIGVVVVVFGVEQLVRPDGVPGVPLERLTPTWIPGHKLWAYVAGVVFVVAGGYLLANRKTRWAATVVGVTVLLLVLLVYGPILGESAADIGNGLNYFADTLLFAGAALLLAEAMPGEGYEYIREGVQQRAGDVASDRRYADERVAYRPQGERQNLAD
ncbi:MAG TPA: DoxX family membrane protein [Candidatus Eremiobacteraceae bacterium]|nr:DoxX family membrane protein [Candidatus Eremiobacteraceae bacterium]